MNYIQGTKTSTTNVSKKSVKRKAIAEPDQNVEPPLLIVNDSDRRELLNKAQVNQQKCILLTICILTVCLYFIYLL